MCEGGKSLAIRRVKLADCLDEVSSGVGSAWANYRVIGATRAGAAPAKEEVGKSPQRYKLVTPGSIFYNPMRILIGSIGMVDDGEEPGITSPDYVVFKPHQGVIHHRWFYAWLRSDYGADFIRQLTRGAVRERLLFRRLAEAEIQLPPWPVQKGIAEQMAGVNRARAAGQEQIDAAKKLASTYLQAAFQESCTGRWPRQRLGSLCELLPAKSIATSGDTTVQAVTSACLTEEGFNPKGVKAARMWLRDAEQATLQPGEILIARSNTAELVGRVARYDGQTPGAVASDLTIRLWPSPSIDASFL